MKKSISAILWFGLAFLVLLLCATRTSPIYSILIGDMMNNHASYTMFAANAITKGMIPLKDFFLITPPLYLFINSIGYMIAKRFGVFILEVISLGIYLNITNHLLSQLINKKKALCITLFTLIPIISMFSGGNNSVEYTLPFNAYILSTIILEKENKFKALSIGICSSIVLLIEPLAIGIPLGVIIIYMVQKHNIKDILTMLLGIAIPLILLFIYLTMNHTLSIFMVMLVDYLKLLKGNIINQSIFFHKLIKNMINLPVLIIGCFIWKKNKEQSISLIILFFTGMIIGLLNDNSWYYFMTGIPTISISLLLTEKELTQKTMKIGLNFIFLGIVMVISILSLKNVREFIYYDNLKVNEELAQKVSDYHQDGYYDIIWFNCDCSIPLYLDDMPTTYYFTQQDLLSTVDSKANQAANDYLENKISYTLLISNEKGFYGKNLDSFILVEGVLRRDYQHYMIYSAKQM